MKPTLVVLCLCLPIGVFAQILDRVETVETTPLYAEAAGVVMEQASPGETLTIRDTRTSQIVYSADHVSDAILAYPNVYFVRSGWRENVVRLNLDTNQRDWAATIGPVGRSIALNPDDRSLLVADRDNGSLHVIDDAGNLSGSLDTFPGFAYFAGFFQTGRAFAVGGTASYSGPQLLRVYGTSGSRELEYTVHLNSMNPDLSRFAVFPLTERFVTWTQRSGGITVFEIRGDTVHQVHVGDNDERVAGIHVIRGREVLITWKPIDWYANIALLRAYDDGLDMIEEMELAIDGPRPADIWFSSYAQTGLVLAFGVPGK